ncbi:hypothetical protein D3C85_1321460 [compost metagenome]
MAAGLQGDAYAVAWFDLAGAVPAAGDGDQSPVGAVSAGADHRPVAAVVLPHGPW